MRGEHYVEHDLGVVPMGSSPHARGARVDLHRGRRGLGIIPACAGSTPTARARLEARRDHPRMRGEHGVAFGRPRLFAGSSPHARGARLEGAVHHVLAGIIPACAGSTRDKGAFAARGWDHPRMRGEHPTRSRRRARPAGSSPHARRARTIDHSGQTKPGIIPACAGSTRLSVLPPRRRRDHPRMRGEHALTLGRKQAGAGSSPHARGAHGLLKVEHAVAGIIPACAGSTCHLRRRLQWRRDHPRMRGEHSAASMDAAASGGSSPHARGARVRPSREADPAGIIPACAGSTA